MALFDRERKFAPVLGRLDGLEAGVVELRHGQTLISNQLGVLQARDGEIEGKLASALDRFSDQLSKQAHDLVEQQRVQIEMFKATLMETSVRKAWVVLRGRGLRWGERAMWLAVLGLGKLVWSHLGHARGWDLLWWWPSW